MGKFVIWEWDIEAREESLGRQSDAQRRRESFDFFGVIDRRGEWGARDV